MQATQARAPTIYLSLPARLANSFRPETIAPSPVNLTFSVIGASLLALADLKEILVGPPVQTRKEMRA